MDESLRAVKTALAGGWKIPTKNCGSLPGPSWDLCRPGRRYACSPDYHPAEAEHSNVELYSRQLKLVHPSRCPRNPPGARRRRAIAAKWRDAEAARGFSVNLSAHRKVPAIQLLRPPTPSARRFGDCRPRGELQAEERPQRRPGWSLRHEPHGAIAGIPAVPLRSGSA